MIDRIKILLWRDSSYPSLWLHGLPKNCQMYIKMKFFVNLKLSYIYTQYTNNIILKFSIPFSLISISVSPQTDSIGLSCCTP